MNWNTPVQEESSQIGLNAHQEHAAVKTATIVDWRDVCLVSPEFSSLACWLSCVNQLEKSVL